MLIEEALALLPSTPVTVETPCGPYTGCKLPEEHRICAVSILRAADCMLGEVRAMMPSVAVGKILIQRDEATALPQLMYSKLPPDVATRPVLLLDPMLATGGSAVAAVKVLVEAGVPPENIVFVNIVCVREGLAALAAAYPAVKVVTGAIDPILNEKKYIVPGLGDFGDRYFGELPCAQREPAWCALTRPGSIRAGDRHGRTLMLSQRNAALEYSETSRRPPLRAHPLVSAEWDERGEMAESSGHEWHAYWYRVVYGVPTIRYSLIPQQLSPPIRHTVVQSQSRLGGVAFRRAPLAPTHERPNRRAVVL